MVPQQWYSPARTLAPPLSDGGTVTLGMGSDRAFEFTLPPGELSSSGFFKVFVTDKHIDLEWIRQEATSFEGTGRLRLSHESLGLVSTRWDGLTVALSIIAPEEGGI